jgi:hypothetical protein
MDNRHKLAGGQAMSEICRITVPVDPNDTSPNQRGHWLRRNRMRKIALRRRTLGMGGREEAEGERPRASVLYRQARAHPR